MPHVRRSRVGHVCAGAAAIIAAIPRGQPAVKIGPPIPVKITEAALKKRGRPAGRKFDKVTYQRDLMRRRRAKP